MSISVDRVLGKLDEYFSKNDYQSAEKHILFWLDEAENEKDNRTKLLLKNELMGLYRKLSRRDEALATVSSALALVNKMGIENDIGAGTTYLNSATVYKAFDMAEKALPVFEKAQKIYENSLAENDKRLAGLYNNMALALVDLKRFSEAENLYNKAISIMRQNLNGELEIAITYLNIATLKENELGEVEAEGIINEYLEKSTKILDSYQNRDGYYAFVCEKCASVYGYYGHFFYENELNKRARSIYEGA